jgi:electron transport complex protein RnfB
LPRMDKELASLVEQYFQEIRGGTIARSAPAVNRVIPVEEAIPFDLEIFPYERASAMLEEAKAWAVRDCICRVQRGLIGKACDHPVENCLVFAPVAGVFDNSKVDRAITKEEALGILREAEESGLVHSTGNYRDGHHYICNCCTCCCGVLRGVAEFGVPTAIAHSDFSAVVDADLCIGCEDCVGRCQFGALAVPEDVCEVDYARCVGCGVCTHFSSSAVPRARPHRYLLTMTSGWIGAPRNGASSWRKYCRASSSFRSSDSHTLEDKGLSTSQRRGKTRCSK